MALALTSQPRPQALMSRFAGDTPEYEFRMMRKGIGGSLTASPFGFSLTSVTTIIGETIPKPFAAGAWHGYRLAIEALQGRDLRGIADVETQLKTEGKNPNQRLADDAARGHIAHDVLEMLANGDEECALGAAEVERELFGVMYSYATVSWWNTVAGKKYLPERPVWSIRDGYAGTADLILPGKEIVDLKTHKPAAGFTKEGFGPAYLSDLVQVRAYRSAWEQMGNGSIPANRIVIVRPNGKFLEDFREVPEELWDKCLEMYKLMKQI